MYVGLVSEAVWGLSLGPLMAEESTGAGACWGCIEACLRRCWDLGGCECVCAPVSGKVREARGTLSVQRYIRTEAMSVCLREMVWL